MNTSLPAQASDGIQLFIVGNQEEEKLSVNKSLSNDEAGKLGG